MRTGHTKKGVAKDCNTLGEYSILLLCFCGSFATAADFGGNSTVTLLKYRREIAGIFEANSIGNLTNALICGTQKVIRDLQAPDCDVLLEILLGMFLEQTADSVNGHVHMIRGRGQAQLTVGEVVIDILQKLYLNMVVASIGSIF